MGKYLNEWSIEGNRVRLSYDIGVLHVPKEDFDRAFGAIVSASYEDVQRDFAIPDEKLWSCNAWVVEGNKVRLSYTAGDLYVAKSDFDRAFGAIINAPYYDVEKDFSIPGKVRSIDDVIANAEQRSEATVSGTAKEDREMELS